MAVFAVIGRRRGALVGMLLGGCLPKDELDSYSGTAGVSGESPGGSPGEILDAGSSAGGGNAGTTGSMPEPDATVGAAGGSGDASSSVPDATTTDAGDGGTLVTSDASPGEPEGARSCDAGALLVAQCAGTGGTLEPGTRDCFFVAAQVLSWQNAVDACAARQSTLVAVKTPERDQFLSALITAPVWIGAREAGMQNPAANAFTWLDGTAVGAVNNWAAGEPDSFGDQSCVLKTDDAPAGPWRDNPCSEANAFVCERRL